jgi:hypothetical protein
MSQSFLVKILCTHVGLSPTNWHQHISGSDSDQHGYNDVTDDTSLLVGGLHVLQRVLTRNEGDISLTR